MTIVVTGGRTYQNMSRINHVLDSIHKRFPITKLIHGNAEGADSLCAVWGIMKLGNDKVKGYPADWAQFGNDAGPIRNQQMIDDNTDILMCVKFSGRGGTLDMMRRVSEFGIFLFVGDDDIELQLNEFEEYLKG